MGVSVNISESSYERVPVAQSRQGDSKICGAAKRCHGVSDKSEEGVEGLMHPVLKKQWSRRVLGFGRIVALLSATLENVDVSGLAREVRRFRNEGRAIHSRPRLRKYGEL